MTAEHEEKSMPEHSANVTVVAHVINDRTEVSDDNWGGIRSIIRLLPDFPAETLLGLEEFSHLQVTWLFHQATSDDVHLGVRHPRGDARWPETGTFAHRNHRRPSQIAISHPRILGIDGRDIHVADLDANNGTPVIDIAPWFKEFGPRGEIKQPKWPGEMLEGYWRESPR